MILKLTIDDQTYDIDVSRQQMEEAKEFYDKMDQDMDKGWMMSRDWVEKPDQTQRCQIAADRIVDSIHAENEMLTQLMAGYIVARMKNVREVHIDTDGDMMETQFITA